jgi:tRNA (guanosine-2'-O-)-methyltransferase
MNAEKWVTARRYRHCLDAVEVLKAGGYTLVATCLDDDAVSIDDVDFAGMRAGGGKIAVMLGNEERGLSKTLRDEADVKVCIPMTGMSQSLNIATTVRLRSVLPALSVTLCCPHACSSVRLPPNVRILTTAFLL